MLMRRLEEAKSLVESERACEDPLLIVPIYERKSYPR